MLTSSISDHSTLLLLLEGVGAVDLLDDFWAEAGDLLSPRRVNDLKVNKQKKRGEQKRRFKGDSNYSLLFKKKKKLERQIKKKVLRFLNA